jgi:hypothetical protein
MRTSTPRRAVLIALLTLVLAMPAAAWAGGNGKGNGNGNGNGRGGDDRTSSQQSNGHGPPAWAQQGPPAWAMNQGPAPWSAAACRDRDAEAGEVDGPEGAEDAVAPASPDCRALREAVRLEARAERDALKAQWRADRMELKRLWWEARGLVPDDGEPDDDVVPDVVP